MYKNINNTERTIKSLKEQYNEIINKCINLNLMDKYDLKGYSTVISCSSNQSNENETLKLCMKLFFYLYSFNNLHTFSS